MVCVSACLLACVLVWLVLSSFACLFVRSCMRVNVLCVRLCAYLVVCLCVIVCLFVWSGLDCFVSFAGLVWLLCFRGCCVRVLFF